MIDGIPSLVVAATGASLLSVAAWSFRALVGSRMAGARLKRAGFEPQGESYVLRLAATEVHATLQAGSLRLVGPPLPPGTPAFHATAEGMGVGPAAVWSGDLAFDRLVRTEHADPHLGVAWLSADVRLAVRAAIEHSATIVDGRWHYEGTLSPLMDVEGIVTALARASEAMACAPESVQAGLERLARTDPVPAVQAHAIDALTERDVAPASLVDLAASPHAGVLLALIRSGGPAAVAAWERLRDRGGPSERWEGAVAAGRAWLEGRLPTDTVEHLVPTLVDALADDGLGPRAAGILASLDRPTLPRELEDHFGSERPPAAQTLARKLQRRGAGAVSLARLEGGEVSLAKE